MQAEAQSDGIHPVEPDSAERYGFRWRFRSPRIGSIFSASEESNAPPTSFRYSVLSCSQSLAVLPTSVSQSGRIYRDRQHRLQLGDVPSATAILDRFLHHAEIINITGKSYRLRTKASPQPDRIDNEKKG